MLMEKDSLFRKIKYLLSFIKGCHESRYHFYQASLNQKFEEDFKKLAFHTRFHRLPALCSGMDDDSIKTAIRFLYLPALFADHHDDGMLISSILAVPPEELRRFEQEKPQLAKHFGIPEEDFLFESFTKFRIPEFPASVRGYMKNTVFLDCGAFIGDSALIMLEFSPSKIYSFDASPKNAEKFKKVMEFNKIPESKVELILTGIGDREYEISFHDTGICSTDLHISGNTKIPIDSLDHLCRNMDRIGFIKSDIEGFGFDMARGMTEILKRDRPVLSLAIYHNPDEFFEIKPLLESLNLNYKFSISAHSYHFWGEIYLHAYPAELTEE